MRILCVDDEPLMLKMLEMAIKEAKPDAELTAHSKQSDLLDDARQNGCDIAFLDIYTDRTAIRKSNICACLIPVCVRTQVSQIGLCRPDHPERHTCFIYFFGILDRQLD